MVSCPDEDFCQGQVFVEDEEETASIGRRIAAGLRVHDLIGLSGPVGSGKTVLARAIIRSAVGSDVAVVSPTFSLVQDYEGPRIGVVHADLYRLNQWTDVRELGLDDCLEDSALIVEWPERLGGHLASLSPNRLMLEIKHPITKDNRSDERRIWYREYGTWRKRVSWLST